MDVSNRSKKLSSNLCWLTVILALCFAQCNKEKKSLLAAKRTSASADSAIAKPEIIILRWGALMIRRHGEIEYHNHHTDWLDHTGQTIASRPGAFWFAKGAIWQGMVSKEKKSCSHCMGAGPVDKGRIKRVACEKDAYIARNISNQEMQTLFEAQDDPKDGEEGSASIDAIASYHDLVFLRIKRGGYGCGAAHPWQSDVVSVWNLSQQAPLDALVKGTLDDERFSWARKAVIARYKKTELGDVNDLDLGSVNLIQTFASYDKAKGVTWNLVASIDTAYVNERGDYDQAYAWTINVPDGPAPELLKADALPFEKTLALEGTAENEVVLGLSWYEADESARETLLSRFKTPVDAGEQ